MDQVTTSRELRVHNQLRMLRVVHAAAVNLTRAELTRRLSLARGSASVLVAELTAARLVAEYPAPQHRPGRPTQLVGAHPQGPTALAVDVREDCWVLAGAELGGAICELARADHDGSSEQVSQAVAAAVSEVMTGRVAAIGVAVPGPVRHGRRLHVASLGWHDVDVTQHFAPAWPPTVVGNDASLAGLAEARRGTLRNVGSAVHLHVDFDVGGALIVDGSVHSGAHGLAGEFGHMRLFGDGRQCHCGARGCWGSEVGAHALLRTVGQSVERAGSRERAQRVFAQAQNGDVQSQAAVTANAAALGAGIGSLANALDPAAVTVSGLGPQLLETSGDEVRRACDAALIRDRRDVSPQIAAAAVGDAGPLQGAAELAFDAALTSTGLQDWLAAADVA